MDEGGTSRRSHKKVRTGCKTCKRRKVKCGEERPQCRNCVKHAVQCDFLDGRSLTRSTNSSSGTPQTNSSAPAHDLSPDETETDTDSHPLALQDLELLHNYTCSTYLSFSTNELKQGIWRVDVPQIGLSHQYVMHGILAVSALELAQKKPDRRDHYIYQATIHHSIALSTARPLLAELRNEDAPGLCIFSILTLIFKVGNQKGRTEVLIPGIEDTFEWFYLLRGTQSIMAATREALYESPIGPIFKNGQRRQDWRSSTTSREVHLVRLGELLRTTLPSEKFEFYSKALEELQNSYALASGVASGLYEFKPGVHEMTDCFIWPFGLENEFVQELQQQVPEALVILAHFCVLLKVWDESCWWMRGWSAHLLSLVYSLLDEGYRSWIQWPMDQTSWVPDT